MLQVFHEQVRQRGVGGGGLLVCVGGEEGAEHKAVSMRVATGAEHEAASIDG
jgi:hypothetical protein